MIDRLKGSALRLTQRLVNAHAVLFGSFEPEIASIVERVRPYTMTSPARVAALCDAVSYIVRHDIPGDIVECGVWKGGSSMAAALRLLQLNRADRALYLFDTFEGMTAPGEHDLSASSGFSAATMIKHAPKSSHLRARAVIDEVEANMFSTGYAEALTHLVKGKVEETVPAQAPQRIAILRLDTDWYESTRHELIELYPRLVSGGILIIDDYGDWQGARRAVDEYFADPARRIFLNRIDRTGRIGVKP